MSRAAPLFTPFVSPRLSLPNRIVMCPMTRQASPQGVPGADVASYYARRAAADVGLIVTEGIAIDHPSAIDDDRVPVLHGNAALAGWRAVVDAVHAAGGRIVPQLWHQGPLRDMRVAGDIEPMRPSGLWGPLGKHSYSDDYIAGIVPETRPMRDAEIADVIAAFARSAKAAADIGFDGIAIHGAHGYLIDSFLWHGTNIRTDAWGGDHAARAAFGVAVVRAIREAVGDALPIVFRFSQHKGQDYTARLAETPAQLEAQLRPLADAGVDIFDASVRRFATPAFDGSPLTLAGWTRKLIGLPTIIVGGVGISNALHEMFQSGAAQSADNIPALIERFEAGEFDLVGIGRALLSNPHFARDLRTGAPLPPFDVTALKELR